MGQNRSNLVRMPKYGHIDLAHYSVEHLKSGFCSGYLAKLGLIWTKYGRGCPAGTVWRLGSGTPSKVRSLVLVCWSTAISKPSFTKKSG